MAARLQIALDLTDLAAALDVCRAAAPSIDIVEVGTLLCLAEGMPAVRALREAFPDKELLADVRIVRAGEKIAAMAFDAGADLVSVVAEAPRETVSAAAEVAKMRDKQIQIELADTFETSDARFWRDLGIEHVITHNTSEVGTVGQGWSQQSLDDVWRLADMGFSVTVTGGITPDTIPTFDGLPVAIFIAGRGIWGADDPGAAASRYRQAIDNAAAA